MNDIRYVTAKEAAGLLDISLPTLYAYVSRGLIRSEAVGGSKRNRRYYREDIEKLKRRKEQRQRPDKVIEQALYFGEPVLASAITLIADGKFYYRGEDATTLAVSQTVEQVAQWVWLGEDGPLDWPAFELSAACQAVLPQLTELTLTEHFQAVLPIAGASDWAAYNLTAAEDVAQTGARIMQVMTALAVGSPCLPGGIATALQQAWTPEQPQAARLINAALILCADHELNISSFTARCVASSGATPYAVVIAGLSALQGAKHGGYTERVEAFMQEFTDPAQLQTMIVGRLKRGEELPGFGHRLYPEGDPRAAKLYQLTTQIYPDSPAIILADRIASAVKTLTGRLPTIDFSLATLAQTLNLPSGSALALFALGRTIGWIGHAIEQYQLDQLIRPRARYTGRLP